VISKLRAGRFFTRALAVVALIVLAGGCGGAEPKTPLLQNRDLDAYRTMAAVPNSETLVVLIATQQFLAAHREWDGYAYFGKLAAEQPQRRALFRSLQGLMQARVANDVSMFKRVAWVEDAIAKLDEGATADPILGRFARGVVFADLPPRFEKAQQAIADLTVALEHADELPTPLRRGIYRGLASAYRTVSDDARSREMLRMSGFESLDDTLHVLGDSSVGPVDGFRFTPPRFVKETEGVYVAEGYDFANISFIVGESFVVAIDAGTNERTARAALHELRKITQAPVKYIIVTHGHWDHAGGVAALREPGSVVITHASFPRVLARSRAFPPPFHDFFGDEKPNLDVVPDRLVAARETLAEGGVDLTLIPGPSGETEDALFILDNEHGILFVGDAFMPYLGAPFVAEGSAEGFLGAMTFVLDLHPRRLVHGHPPLTDLFSIEAMPGLREATTALYERTVQAAGNARPIADVLHDDFIAPVLRSAPKAVAPYLVMRDTFIQRVYTEHAGYWSADGTGVDHFTRDEWARSLDLLGGGTDASFVRAVNDLLERGDAPMALHLADSGLIEHPSSPDLRAARARALTALQERYVAANPFHFILESEWAGHPLPPLGTPAATP